MRQGLQAKNGKNTLVALGSNATSNAGGPLETVQAGLHEIANVYGDVNVSNMYQTPAFPAGSGPDFVNAACVFKVDVSPTDVLATLHEIEAQFDRTRDVRWGQRTLDLDLIACGDVVLPDTSTFDYWANLPLEAQKTTAPDRLILPHPRLQDRPFVLVPLCDVAPDWVHPVLGMSVRNLLDRFDLADLADVTRL